MWMGLWGIGKKYFHEGFKDLRDILKDISHCLSLRLSVSIWRYLTPRIKLNKRTKVWVSKKQKKKKKEKENKNG